MGQQEKGEEVAREKGSKVTGHSLAFHSGYHTLPYPGSSEMLIKGQVPEELSAVLRPACSTRLSWFIGKEAIASPQGNGSEFGVKSSLQVFACLFSQKARLFVTWERGSGFTLELAPEAVDKAEMRGVLRKRRSPTSFHF